jgi:hypothetical protein
MKLEVPEDLRNGFGYPQITLEDKRKILGLNMAKLFDVDVEAKIKELQSLPRTGADALSSSAAPGGQR